MAQVSGTLGSRLFISSALIASTVDTEAEFSAKNWIEVGLVENFGEFGRLFDLVTFQAVADGRTYKLKGGYNDGAMQATLGQDITDAGQALLRGAAMAATQDNWGFKIEMNDRPSSFGGPTTFYFRGLAMSFRTTLGAVNSVVRANANIEINSDILYTPAAQIYDTYAVGATLDDNYALFDGSDPEALPPAINGSGNLLLVSGNVSAGADSVNGSQIITDSGFIISDGAITLECRVSISAITAVRFFFGLTDQNAALEIPIESAASADTITTNASDAVGFMFDTAMSTDNIWLVGVNNNVDETAQNSGAAFVAATVRVLRIEIDASGNATFYMNGVAVGSVMTTALATGVTLYPTFALSSLGTASRTATVTYLYLRQD